jgi:hypothetical protein
LTMQGHDDRLELITDIQFVGIKQQKNHVTLGCKPLCHTCKLITPLCVLLLTRVLQVCQQK